MDKQRTEFNTGVACGFVGPVSGADEIGGKVLEMILKLGFHLVVQAAALKCAAKP